MALSKTAVACCEASPQRLLREKPFQLLPLDKESKCLLEEIRKIADIYFHRAIKAHRLNVEVREFAEDTLRDISGDYDPSESMAELLEDMNSAVVLGTGLSEEVIPEIEEIICYVQNAKRAVLRIRKTYKGKQNTTRQLARVGSPSTCVAGGAVAGAAYCVGAGAVAVGALAFAAPLAFLLLCMGLQKSKQHERSTLDLDELSSALNLVEDKLLEHVNALDRLNEHLAKLVSCREEISWANEWTLRYMTPRIKQAACLLLKASETYNELVKPVTKLRKDRGRAMSAVDSAFEKLRIAD